MRTTLKLLFGANILMVSFFVWKYQTFPQEIPLFYSEPWGEPQIADIWFILLIPIFMNLMFFVNSQVAKKYFPNNSLFKKILSITNGTLIICFTGIFIKILLLVA